MRKLYCKDQNALFFPSVWSGLPSGALDGTSPPRLVHREPGRRCRPVEAGGPPRAEGRPTVQRHDECTRLRYKLLLPGRRRVHRAEMPDSWVCFGKTADSSFVFFVVTFSSTPPPRTITFPHAEIVSKSAL